jgi:amidophosphoribosyltransferase
MVFNHNFIKTTQSSFLHTHPWSDDDHPKEECGVFGIANHSDASAHCALGLHALQHRGQEAAGIVTFDGELFYTHHALGLVGDNFNTPNVIHRLKGNHAIGHVRYSTAGGSFLRNIQPVFAELSIGGVAISHNGNLTNANSIRRHLVARGCIFQSTMDTEIIIHLIAVSNQSSFLEKLTESLQKIQGAYSLVILTTQGLYGVRDPHGVRPLVIGKLGHSYILASETCALDIIGADFIRDVAPGEIVFIDSQNQIHSHFPLPKQSPRFCIFEYIYFARPDSLIEQHHVYKVRKAIGAELAIESHVDADLVVPVPDSGVPAAMGYAAQAGLPFELGIIRNHYVGRTFIEPTDQVRHLGVKLKHNANANLLEGKSVILVDDSIVRGTTSGKIVDMVRLAGAKNVHLRIASPPTTHSCYYGVDTPEREKLMAAQLSIPEMAKHIGVDSLAFISLDGLYRAVGQTKRDPTAPRYCDACFTGEYPIELIDKQEDINPIHTHVITESVKNFK